jgi:septal ring factor EnvC (AmiA/AmiB activator)
VFKSHYNSESVGRIQGFQAGAWDVFHGKAGSRKRVRPHCQRVATPDHTVLLHPFAPQMAHDLKRQLEAAVQARQAAQEQAQSATADLESARTRISVLQSEMASLQAEVEAMSQQLQELQVRRDLLP